MNCYFTQTYILQIFLKILLPSNINHLHVYEILTAYYNIEYEGNDNRFTKINQIYAYNL